MSMVILADLDDTIFTTKVADPTCPSLECITHSPTGRVSYLDAHARLLLNWIQQGNTLIPVTARGADAFARVRLPFEHGAIIANGAIILKPSGEEDRGWSAHTRQLALEAKPAMEAASAALAQVEGGTITAHRHATTTYGITAKARDRSPAGVEAYISAARTALAAYGLGDTLWAHANSNFLALVPHGISKQAAVQRMLATRPELAGRPLVGAGDSTSDLGFMALCDVLMIPRRSQNASVLLERAGAMPL